MKTIALANHKSINHVQHELYLGHNSFYTRCSKPSAWNAFCWKKKKEHDDGTLCFLPLIYTSPSCLKTTAQLPGGRSTLSLSMEDKAALIEEYMHHKEHKTFGLHATAKSKVNDITGTLKAVENEVYFIFLFFIFSCTCC
ncbi:hypothetical protein PISMIDRAFT_103147 [Pisolithus microcarpus 441]|uniref:Uncharacterized protein n=1 Tax=Pisolithus microcarpus 441 TaxID=765257 RepID=A0A0C9ZHI6_9AGAM|nr:hypothetical protein PISMIDRAFT_103147 [Pisolithus microcarpus 441]